MKYLVIIYFLLVNIPLVCNLSAQNRGKVMDAATGEPLDGASVTLVASRQVIAVTDDEGGGSFPRFVVVNDADTLHISYVGYVTEAVTYSGLRGKDYVVSLKEDTQSLGMVTVRGKQDLKWSLEYVKLSSMKTSVFGFGSVLTGNKIYVIGGDESVMADPLEKAGMGGGFEWTHYNNRMQVYDIATDKWEVSEQKFSKRAYHNVLHNNGRLYILGGKRLAKNPRLEYLNENVEVYDIERDTLIVDKNNPHQAVNFMSVVLTVISCRWVVR